MASSMNESGIISMEEFTAGIQAFVTVSNNRGDNWTVKQAPADKHILYLVKKELKPVHLGEKNRDLASQSSFSCLMNDMELTESEDMAVLDIGEKQSSASRSLDEELQVCSFEYHIVYNPSYRVPVLFLNVYKNNGKLLSLNELWDSIPVYYHERMKYERWSFITQSEHPLLGTPFFQLHPCHTADLMKTVSSVGICIEPQKQSTKLLEQSLLHESSEVKSIKNLAMSNIGEDCTENRSSYNSDTMCTVNPALKELAEIVDLDNDDILNSKHYLGYKYLVSWLSAIAPVVQLNIPLEYAV